EPRRPRVRRPRRPAARAAEAESERAQARAPGSQRRRHREGGVPSDPRTRPQQRRGHRPLQLKRRSAPLQESRASRLSVRMPPKTIALLFAATAAAATHLPRAGADIATYQARANALCRAFTPKLQQVEADAKRAKAAGDVHRSAFD